MKFASVIRIGKNVVVINSEHLIFEFMLILRMHVICSLKLLEMLFLHPFGSCSLFSSFLFLYPCFLYFFTQNLEIWFEIECLEPSFKINCESSPFTVETYPSQNFQDNQYQSKDKKWRSRCYLSQELVHVMIYWCKQIRENIRKGLVSKYLLI